MTSSTSPSESRDSGGVPRLALGLLAAALLAGLLEIGRAHV